MYKNIAMVFMVLGLITASLKVKTSHENGMKLAESGYAAGCYSFAQAVCPNMLHEDERNQCYRTALQCESSGKRFRIWIEMGKK